MKLKTLFIRVFLSHKIIACTIFRIGCLLEQLAIRDDPQALLVLKYDQWQEYTKLKKAFDKPA